MSAASPAARSTWRRLLEHFQSLAHVSLDEPGEILVFRNTKDLSLDPIRERRSHVHATNGL